MKERWTARLRCYFWVSIVAVVLLIAGIVTPALAENGEKQVVHLYFAQPNRPFLVGEQRVLTHTGDALAFGRQILTELMAGSTQGNLSTIPDGTVVRSFFILNDKTAVADFSDHLRSRHEGSCRKEQLTLFSIVNSLVLNCQEIDRAQILIDGEPIQTLAGHVALEFPLTADMLLTR